MSEDKQVSSEYLKRTCLICGCHTDQTINIYEPRSGPNIVKLIQAKFKFQPLNEDRYLCFSCNNWLVNWHSLQTVNSNEAENSSNVNNSSSHMLHDKININIDADRCAGDDNDDVSIALALVADSQQRPQTQRTRPVATVRPRQLAAERPTPTVVAAPPTALSSSSSSRQRRSLGYGKRFFRRGQQLRRRINEHKLLRQCSICGCAIVLRLLGGSSGSLNLAKLQRAKYTRCRKCREIMHWRALHMRSLRQQAAFVQKSSRVVHSNVSARRSTHSNNQSNHNNNNNNSSSSSSSHSSNDNVGKQNYQKPRVDGKVVSMFRRLGTTMCREPQQATANKTTTRTTATTVNTLPPPSSPPPPIMSPAKQRPRWTRTLDDDEILLEFDTAISEVLPVVTAASAARRKLTYTMTDAEQQQQQQQPQLQPNQQEEEEERPTAVAQSIVNFPASFRLPQGLSITLV